MQGILTSARDLMELILATDPAIVMPIAALVSLSIAAWIRNWVRVSLATTLVLAAWILAMPGGVPLYQQLKEQRQAGGEQKELVSCIRHAGRDIEVWTGEKMPDQVTECSGSSAQA